MWKLPEGVTQSRVRSNPAYLLYHLPDFPLLALKHVIQVVDLLPQPSHFLFQVSSSGD